MEKQEKDKKHIGQQQSCEQQYRYYIHPPDKNSKIQKEEETATIIPLWMFFPIFG